MHANERTRDSANPLDNPAVDFLAGGGGMGALMRAHDWSNTPFGPPETWPQSLRSAISICLGTSFPIAIYWGPELALLYNDAWSPIPGNKHPWALGRPGREVWPEIWDTIGPLYEKVQTTGEGVWQQDQLLAMHRHGYTEECYFNFTFSPIRGEGGKVEGIFNAVIETTFRVIGERRERTLRRLAESIAEVRSEDDAFAIVAKMFAADSADVPFSLVYRLDAAGRRAHLAGLAELAADGPASPTSIDMADAAAPWPLANVVKTGRSERVDDLSARFGFALPGGPWHEPAECALVAPIGAAASGFAGFLVVGISPRRALDDDYQAFIERAAAHLAAAIANARAYQQERHRAEALAEIDRAKTAFFSNISHEFRTPLTLMLGPLEDALAEAGALTARQRERLEAAHRNSLRLLRLVNALLDFSRIEAGRVRASFRPTDLSALTAELASSFRSATERAGLALIVECQPLSEPVYVDRDMWEKVVLNLMSNAFKFTFEGEIAVELRELAGMAELTVRDTGIGIPGHELPRLFERFHRVSGAHGRSFEGSGIGLALMQELVKLHGGEIEVTSEVGRGTTFTVKIPRGTEHLPADYIETSPDGASTAVRVQSYVEEALRWLPGSATAALLDDGATQDAPFGRTEPNPPPERQRVVLADDNSDLRSYIARLLSERGYEVQAVADGEAALAAIRTARPDLLITDVMMPKLDGFDLLRAVRNDAALRDLPVIMLSARAGEEAKVEGFSAGADDYLTKPFSARELLARVGATLAMARVRHEAAEAIRATEARSAEVLESMGEGYVLLDREFRVVRINAEGLRLNGRPASEILGKTYWEAWPGTEEVPQGALYKKAMAERVPVALDVRHTWPDGHEGWVAIRAYPSGDGLAIFYRDITERKQAEEALRELNEGLETRVVEAIAERRRAEAALQQAQKMEAIGQLTGGVAHDFNNLLQVISGNLQLLAKDVAGNDRAEQRVQTALAGVSRGAKLASQLLAFSRRQPLEPKVINVGRFVRGLDEMLRRTLGEEIEIETTVTGGLWNTFADPTQIENALLNLAINARDAMDGRGRLTIEVGNAFLDDEYARSHVEVDPGQYVMLAVTDTGCGMPPEIVEKVFEPFFSTKPEGKGTGLGLSMVFGFVKQSGGHVKVYSEVGHGTTVKLYLPRVNQSEDVAVEAAQKPVTGGTETILVIEDDEEVRATAVEMLSDLGYRVLKAPDATAALAIIESGIGIDLLFTDVVMPGPLRAPELARKARERLPNIAVLFTSGYTENAIVHGGRLDEDVQLISKPYTREALARKIRHVLANQQQRSAAVAPASQAVRTADRAAQAADPLTVLLVEDDALIRMSTAEMLKDLGHVVAEAASADEALLVLQTYPVDVLITDIELVGTSGAELAERARLLRAGIGIIFATGKDQLPARKGRERDGAVLLRKPYDSAGLADSLRHVSMGPRAEAE